MSPTDRVQQYKQRLVQHSQVVDVALLDLKDSYREAQDFIWADFDEQTLSKHEQALEEAFKQILDEVDEVNILRAVKGATRDIVASDAADAQWYHPGLGKQKIWPRLRNKMVNSMGEEITAGIDEASDDVMRQLANPKVAELKKKGLVVGFVQSGKTANYASVIAKAFDQGYKFVLVLAGIHNNLRSQTQRRLDDDLGVYAEKDTLHALTTEETDFERLRNANSLFEQNLPIFAVVKKNSSRLANVKRWLNNTSEHHLQRTPILIIDDEADQATPNNKEDVGEVSTINRLLQEIWGIVSVGTYVGYTATPFANVFMDPDNTQQLFPSHFVLSLPRPEAYFGAERVFGKTSPDDAETPDDGLDMTRIVPDEDAESMRPSAKERLEFDFDVPESLRDAVRWFILATAIRKARGQVNKHSSMLVHITHYSDPHFVIQDRIQELVTQFAQDIERGDFEDFQQQFAAEKDRVKEVRTVSMPSWEEVAARLPDVLSETQVVVDNGSKNAQRVNYDERDAEGNVVPQTVIAVGGGTLSRGLTLEGLVVSYFIRTSSDYDTLLQMGRWFGFRTGYEDLPRVWTQAGLIQDYQFLAMVEEELRDEIESVTDSGVDPEAVGIKIRQHPGRLNITAKNRLFHQKVARVGLSGQTKQTIFFNARAEVQQSNIHWTKTFLKDLQRKYDEPARPESGNYVFTDVASSEISHFLNGYDFVERGELVNRDKMTEWIDTVAPDRKWNVVVVNGKANRTFEGRPLDLGTLDLGLESPLNTINRARLDTADGSDDLYIKALMSARDLLLDLPQVDATGLGGNARQEIKKLREENAQGNGLLVIYPISKNSIPLHRTPKGSRKPLKSEEHLVGLGLVFPKVTEANDGDFVSVRSDWEISAEPAPGERFDEDED